MLLTWTKQHSRYSSGRQGTLRKDRSRYSLRSACTFEGSGVTASRSLRGRTGTMQEQHNNGCALHASACAPSGQLDGRAQHLASAGCPPSLPPLFTGLSTLCDASRFVLIVCRAGACGRRRARHFLGRSWKGQGLAPHCRAPALRRRSWQGRL